MSASPDLWRRYDPWIVPENPPPFLPAKSRWFETCSECGKRIWPHRTALMTRKPTSWNYPIMEIKVWKCENCHMLGFL